LGCLIIIGTFLSYVAQWVSIVWKKSSEGISWMCLAIGLAAGLLTLTNGAILNWETLNCCSVVNMTLSKCFEVNLVIQQLTIGPICQILLFVVFIYYYSFLPLSNQTLYHKEREYVYALVGFAACLVVCFFMTALCFILYFGGLLDNIGIKIYAQTLGTLAGIFTVFIWIPQIYYTGKSQNTGALSLPMLLIQGPGSAAAVYFQIASGQHWTTWVPYAAAGFQQLLLVIMLCFFLYSRLVC